MVLNKLKIGDTVSVFDGKKFLFKGIIYIIGQIPLGKFYERQLSINSKGLWTNNIVSDDIYESAIVIIDDKSVENLIVLTLENDDYKLFIWNDLINKNKTFKYERLLNKEQIKIISDDAVLTEITYRFS